MEGSKELHNREQNSSLSSSKVTANSGSVREDPGYYVEVGRRIGDARKAARITQEELAKRLGMTRGSISRIEIGAQRFLAHSLKHIAQALNVPQRTFLPDETFTLPEPILVDPADHDALKRLIRREKEQQEKR